MKFDDDEQKHKAKKKMVCNQLQNFFTPREEHTGFDKAKTIREISQFIVNKCKLGKKADRNSKYFWEVINSKLSNILHTTLLNPKCDEYYMKGLRCEPVCNRVMRIPKEGHYYFLASKDEQRRVERCREADIEARQIKHNINIVADNNYFLQIENERRLQIENARKKMV